MDKYSVPSRYSREKQYQLHSFPQAEKRMRQSRSSSESRKKHRGSSDDYGYGNGYDSSAKKGPGGQLSNVLELQKKLTVEHLKKTEGIVKEACNIFEGYRSRYEDILDKYIMVVRRNRMENRELKDDIRKKKYGKWRD